MKLDMRRIDRKGYSTLCLDETSSALTLGLVSQYPLTSVYRLVSLECGVQ